MEKTDQFLSSSSYLRSSNRSGSFAKLEIQDPIGEVFWTKSFLNKESVGWTEFVEEFFSFFGGRFISQSADRKEREEVTHLQYALQAMGGRVTMSSFAAFLQWHGPLPPLDSNQTNYQSDKIESFLKNIFSLQSYKWFGGFLTHEEVEGNFAMAKKKGMYTVLYSLSIPGSYKIAYLDKDSKLIYERIQHMPGSTYRMGSFEFSSLKSLIKDKIVIKKLSLKKPYKQLSVAEVILKVNTPMMQRLRRIEEEEGNVDQIWDIPPTMDVNTEFKKLRDRFIRANFRNPGICIRIVPINKHIVAEHVESRLVLYEIRADSVDGKRAAFDLAVVLDKSGSMQGAPLMYSLKAISNIVNSMGNHDRLHFVAYDHSATAVVENGTVEERDSILERINRVEAGGGTNIEAALRVAKKLLVNDSKLLQQKRRRRIFLFSDGVPSTGLKSKDELCQLTSKYFRKHQIVTSSYGIGYEFDEKLMQSISEAGGGNYFYIDKPERIPDLVQQGVDGLVGLIGTDAFLTIETIPGTRIKHILGNPALINERGTKIGDLRRKDFIQVLVELEIDARNETPKSSKGIATFEMSFLTAAGPVSYRNSLHICFESQSEEQMTTVKDDDVNVAYLLRQSLDIDDQVLAFIKEKDFVSAVNMKRLSLNTLSKAATKDHTGVTDIPLLKARQLLQQIKQMRWDNTIQASVLKHVHYYGYVSKSYGGHFLI